jgi:hypothetical protein
VDRCTGLAGDFDFAAGVVDAVGDCGLRAVFVDGCGGLGKGGGVGVGVGDIVGPVWAAECRTMLEMSSAEGERCLRRAWSVEVVTRSLERRSSKVWKELRQVLPCNF